MNKTEAPVLGRIGTVLCICAALTACGGSSDGDEIVSDPPDREGTLTLANEALSDSIPETSTSTSTSTAAVKLAQVVIQRPDPVSTTDPVAALNGNSVANSFSMNGDPNRPNLKLSGGLEGLPLPTGKWYTPLLFQSPRDLNYPFNNGTEKEQSAFPLPYRLWLDDRLGMVVAAFPRRRFIAGDDATTQLEFGKEFSNPYFRDYYSWRLEPDERADVFVSFKESSSGPLPRRIDRGDELMVTTSWNGSAAAGTSMKLIAGVGSPYITVQYKKLSPLIGVGAQVQGRFRRDAANNNLPGDADNSKWEIDGTIKSVASGDINGMKFTSEFRERGGDKLTPDLTGTKFRFVYQSLDNYFRDSGKNYFKNSLKQDLMTQRVMVVYSSSPLTLSWDPVTRTYAATAPFTGTIRAAFVDEQDPDPKNPDLAPTNSLARETFLDQYVNEFPVSGQVVLNYDGSQTGTVKYNWQTASMSGSSAPEQLLMMGVEATHLKDMPTARQIDLRYRSIYGSMRGVVGSTWSQVLKVPDILQVKAGTAQEEILWLGNGSIKDSDKDAIRKSLDDDYRMYTDPGNPYPIPECNDNSYNCGKLVGLLARMVLIAHQLATGQKDGPDAVRREQYLELLKKHLNVWFKPKDAANQPDYFQYDTVNKGVVTRLPFRTGKNTDDFLNAQYVDHMFHYGYYIYASAVVARFDTNWRNEYREAVDALVRDIANPNSADKYFPITRTYDWFKMQNMADARPELRGPNTESSSEAVNAGYALVLWGAANRKRPGEQGPAELGDLEAMASLMVAGEIRTAQTFYQVSNDTKSIRFEEVKPVTVSSGAISSLELNPTKIITWGIHRTNVVEHNLFFSGRLSNLVGIQVLPVTPITDYVIPAKWASDHAAELRALEDNETMLFNAMFENPAEKFTAETMCARGDPKQAAASKTPAADCAGQARLLYSWRQMIISVNALNDPAGAYERYKGFWDALPKQVAIFQQKADGTPNGRTQAPLNYGPDINVDVLKDLSTPSNNSNVLWWLSTHKK